MSTLEDMEQEAASLPAAVPETEGLTALIQKAEEWKAKSAALAAQKAPLKKMREVLHMGLRMPVEVPQVEALRAEIRRREWEDTAKKVCSFLTSTCLRAWLCMPMHIQLLLCYSQFCVWHCSVSLFQLRVQICKGKDIELCIPHSL